MPSRPPRVVAGPSALRWPTDSWSSTYDEGDSLYMNYRDKVRALCDAPHSRVRVFNRASRSAKPVDRDAADIRHRALRAPEAPRVPQRSCGRTLHRRSSAARRGPQRLGQVHTRGGTLPRGVRVHGRRLHVPLAASRRAAGAGISRRARDSRVSGRPDSRAQPAAPDGEPARLVEAPGARGRLLADDARVGGHCRGTRVSRRREHPDEPDRVHERGRGVHRAGLEHSGTRAANWLRNIWMCSGRSFESCASYRLHTGRDLDALAAVLRELLASSECVVDVAP